MQRGLPESKKPGDEGPGGDEEQLVGEHARSDSSRWARSSGWRLWVYSNSLLLVMGAVFVCSWLIQGLAGATVHSAERVLHGLPPVSFGEYLVSADFWNRTLQNWQSEPLAVGCMVAFAIFLGVSAALRSRSRWAPCTG